MALRAVLEVIVDALFLAQAFDEVQIGFVVLGAVIPLRIDHRAKLETVGVCLDAVAFKQFSDDLRHGQVLEDALIGAVCEIGQLRNDRQPITGQALAELALPGAVDDAVDAVAVGAEGEERALVQQAGQVEICALADQFHIKAVGLADGRTWRQMTPSVFGLFF